MVCENSSRDQKLRISNRSCLPMVADQCRIGVMAKMQKKTLPDPEEQRLFDKGQLELRKRLKMAI